ncbi:MAG TPA: hypothetical protein VMT52_06525, partial [Planctomycetota bacterium]|nr:hypothetical protein [Planctomycetota bacterium]
GGGGEAASASQARVSIRQPDTAVSMSYSHLLGFLFLGGGAHALGPDCVRLPGCPEACAR